MSWVGAACVGVAGLIAGWIVATILARRANRILIAILSVLASTPDRTALDICVAIDRPWGSIHPLLAKAERIGLITSAWSSQDRIPRSRIYNLAEQQ